MKVFCSKIKIKKKKITICQNEKNKLFAYWVNYLLYCQLGQRVKSAKYQAWKVNACTHMILYT